MLVQQEHCDECDRHTYHYNGKCGVCSEKEADQRKRMYFTSLQGLTLEERIDRIEKSLYEMSINPPWRDAVY